MELALLFRSTSSLALLRSFLQNISLFFQRLTVGQRVALGSVFVGGLAILITVAYWANQPDYALLFGRLDPTDANRIVETLRSDGTKFDVREDGTAVYVPRDQVSELRLRFAGEGLVSDGPIGYELFDQNTLGMTDFMQQLNMKRALEGELARTIADLKQVEMCRVHLTIPERSPFRELQNPPTASVTLTLSGGGRLSSAQIEGITALVAGAVEGLAPSDVTIIDNRGNLLSDPNSGDPDLMASSNQLKRQREVEQHLTEKAQSMLNEVLGPDNAIVRVAVQLDFTEVTEQTDIIDPESATVISEERQENTEDAAQGTLQIRNYQISRTQGVTQRNQGEIDFLTVSLILNMKPGDPAAPVEGEEAPAAPAPVPFAPDEIVELEALVQNAVAFDPGRGDRITTHQTTFDTSIDDQVLSELRDQQRKEDMQRYLRYGLLALALGLAFWLIRSTTQRVTAMAEERAMLEAEERRTVELKQAEAEEQKRLAERAAEEEELVLVDDLYMSKLSPEARARLKAKHQMFEEVQQQVLDRPEDAADMLRIWLAGARMEMEADEA